jgi:tetratricopeptide (TPR) repeat protein
MSFGARILHGFWRRGIVRMALLLVVIPAISRSSPPGLLSVGTEKTSTAAKDDLGQLLRLEQYIQDGKLREVEPLLRSYLKAHPESARAYYDLGYVCFRTHQLSASIEALAKCLGTRSNRSAIGARVRVIVGEHAQMQEVISGSSYMSQSDLRLHFGLGKAKTADLVEITRPSGVKEPFRDVRANPLITIQEGRGIVKEEAFGRQQAAPNPRG